MASLARRVVPGTALSLEETPVNALTVSRTLCIAALAVPCAPAFAGVKSATASSFEIVHQLEVEATPAALFKALGEVSKWWSSDHTYSGNSANLKLELSTGGCFCESWRTGGVVHGTVINVRKDALVRL